MGARIVLAILLTLAPEVASAKRDGESRRTARVQKGRDEGGKKTRRGEKKSKRLARARRADRDTDEQIAAHLREVTGMNAPRAHAEQTPSPPAPEPAVPPPMIKSSRTPTRRNESVVDRIRRVGAGIPDPNGGG